MGLREELTGYFDDSFSRQAQEAIIKCIFGAYTNAWKKSKEYLPEEAHDLLGYLRWIEIRSQLRGIGGRYSTIKTSVETSGPSPFYHVTVESEKFILTVSSVPTPSVMPRPAAYRVEYAVQTQLSLFGDPPKPNSKIYGILVHGPNQKDKSKPDFLQVRFPNRDYEEYIPHTIDLFARFADLTNNLLGISKKQEPQIMPQSKRKGEENEA